MMKTINLFSDINMNNIKKNNYFFSLCEALTEHGQSDEIVILFLEELNISCVPLILIYLENKSDEFKISFKLNYKIAVYLIEKNDKRYKKFLNVFLTEESFFDNSMIIHLIRITDKNNFKIENAKLLEKLISDFIPWDSYDCYLIARELARMSTPDILNQIIKNNKIRSIECESGEQFIEETGIITQTSDMWLTYSLILINESKNRLINEKNTLFIDAIELWIQELKADFNLKSWQLIPLSSSFIIIKIFKKDYIGAKTELIKLMNILNHSSNLYPDDLFCFFEIITIIKRLGKIPDLLEKNKLESFINRLMVHLNILDKNFPFNFPMVQYIEEKNESKWSKSSIFYNATREIFNFCPRRIKLAFFLSACGAKKIDNGINTYLGERFIQNLFKKDLNKMMHFVIDIKRVIDEEIINKLLKSNKTNIKAIDSKYPYDVFLGYKLIERILIFLLKKYFTKRKLDEFLMFSKSFIPSKSLNKVFNAYFELHKATEFYYNDFNRFKSLYKGDRNLLLELSKDENFYIPVEKENKGFDEKKFYFYINLGDLANAKNELIKIKDIIKQIKKEGPEYYNNTPTVIKYATKYILVGMKETYQKIMNEGIKMLDKPDGEKHSRIKPDRQLSLINSYIENGFLIEALNLSLKDYGGYRRLKINREKIVINIAKAFNSLRFN